MTARVSALVLALVATGVAVAQGPIRVWYAEPNDPSAWYTDQYSKAITIYKPVTIKVEAVNQDGTLADIDQISVDATCPAGTVTVSVVRDPNEVGGVTKDPGVYALKEINLTKGWPPDPNVIGVIQIVCTAGDLGEVATTWATTIAGPMLIGQGIPGGADILTNIYVEQLDGDIVCNTLGSLYVTGEGWNNTGWVHVLGDWDGEIQVAGSLGGLWFSGSATHDLWYSGIHIAGGLGAAIFEDVMGTSLVVNEGEVGGDLGYLDVFIHRGEIIVNGSIGEVSVATTAPYRWWDPYSSSAIVARGVTSSLAVTYAHGGVLQVNGSVPEVQIGNDMDGSVYVEQSLGPIAIGGHLSGSLTLTSDLTSSIVVSGDLTGTIDISGRLGSVENPITDLSGGYIIVNGSFVAPAHIYANGLDPNSSGFIAIDYDGWHDGHDWGSGVPNDANNAQVYLYYNSPQDYRANDPAQHVWHITKCKTDMNNDGIVSWADINPFVQALTNPVGYAHTYPGLGGVAPDPNTGGSRVFHGDLNCDGVFSYADINPFNARVSKGCCSPDCGPCASLLDGRQEPTPRETATQFMLNIDPDLYDGLVDIVSQAAAGLDDSADRAYWQTVYQYLTK